MPKRKDQILERITSNLAQFEPSRIGSFVCPTCLKLFPITSKSEITQAHVVPRYCGGGLKTYLCKACNSHFGKYQDEWFGEYLYLARSGKGLFATKKQSRTFTINGAQVTGEFRETDDGSLEFYIYKDLMSPDAVAAMKAAETPGRRKISVPIPILEKSHLITVGFLTAGYLLWFKELGYSWVFQAHLDPVRAQILSPNERVIPSTCVLDAGDVCFDRPWIGFVELDNNCYPCAGIADRFVIFPSFSSPRTYERLAARAGKGFSVKYESIRISDYHQFPDPVGIIYRDQAMTFADHFCNNSVAPVLLLYLGDGQPPQAFLPMDSTQRKRWQHERHQDTATARIKVQRGPAFPLALQDLPLDS